MEIAGSDARRDGNPVEGGFVVQVGSETVLAEWLPERVAPPDHVHAARGSGRVQVDVGTDRVQSDGPLGSRGVGVGAGAELDVWPEKGSRDPHGLSRKTTRSASVSIGAVHGHDWDLAGETPPHRPEAVGVTIVASNRQR